MLTRNRKNSGIVVAVEISARALRILTLRTGKGGVVVENYERCTIPGEDQEGRHENLVRNLAALRDLAGERNAEIRIALDIPTLLFRNLEFPPMPESEIAAAVRYHWAELTETPPDQMACDLALNAAIAPARGDRTKVLLAAVPRADLEALLAPFREAGLEPTAVVPAPAALHALRMFETGGAGASSELEVIVDIGETRTAVALVQGAHFFMAREITTGGATFTRTLQRELDLGSEEAEKLKCLHGILDPDEPVSPELDASTARSILFALRSVAERLVGEIERTVAHAREHHGAGRVGCVLLTGGGAKLRGLDQLIAAAMDAPVETWRPGLDLPALKAGTGSSGQEDGGGPGAAISPVCLGTAVLGPALNLLSPSTLLRPRRRPGPAMIGLLGACVLALVAGVGWHVWKASQVAGALEAREARLAALVTAGGNAGALHPVLLSRQWDDFDFTAIFWELDRLAPGGVVIDSLALSRPGDRAAPGARGRVLRLGGTAGGATTFAEANLALFLDSLEASPAFRNIQLVRSASLNNREGDGLRFGFTCEIEQASAWAGLDEGLGDGAGGGT